MIFLKRYIIYNRDFFPLFAAVLCAAGCAAFLVYSGETAEAVRRGIGMCCSSVIPSLFSMMFLSQYMIKSGAAAFAGEILNKPARFLFGLPGVCGVAMLTAFIGGYPAGARAAESLTESGAISRAEGERLANIAFCAGPGFAISMIGASIYNNKYVGMLLLTAQALSCIIIGIAYNLADGMTGVSRKQKARDARNNNPISQRSDAFVRSASDTASTMLGMCSFIVLFQVIMSVIDITGLNNAVGAMTQMAGWGDFGRYILPCMTEVTAGSVLSSGIGLPFTAFVIGFGGLSVHFQNFAVCRTIHPRKWLYLLTRMVQGALCSGIVSLGLRLPFFASASVQASKMIVYGLPTEFSRVSVGFGCTMLVMCLMSVICLPHGIKESD